MQVLLGLQSNAIKFTEKGTVQTRVQIIKEGLDRYLKISVQDTGIGIRLKDQDKLFKLFGFVQDQKDMNVNGIGLGLMISKQIVEKFGGEINFESKHGVGSTFTFTFKLSDKNQNSLQYET
jgi:signal transduction histidine kinase